MTNYYSTGELAKACQVTVRTIQFYYRRGLLYPAINDDGINRKYDENDKLKLELILLLKGWGLTLKEIKDLLQTDTSIERLNLILGQRIYEVEHNIVEEKKLLERIKHIRKYLKLDESEESLVGIRDLERVFYQRKEMKHVYRALYKKLIPVAIIEVMAIALSISLKKTFPFLIALPYLCVSAYQITRFMYLKTQYFCLECHAQFKPSIREYIKARHTHQFRKLHCSQCERYGDCLEVAEKDISVPSNQ
ncbi:MerR family transcriptional regulator [Staphylococcus sp. SQ8-PEA]|uniref:MerR family transcriptional regulator n=1 Tax=Staphylococcus marylandisciuri TaxID=2981529 RepID=A0ABT2QMW4_9STAP|nr:MerR family transcriptional regulator [Staphylococcus marylandisciuri]MCU5745323.1 MerR family transcriptional regulator [Staphylococcus marylandisciuri]